MITEEFRQLVLDKLFKNGKFNHNCLRSSYPLKTDIDDICVKILEYSSFLNEYAPTLRERIFYVLSPFSTVQLCGYCNINKLKYNPNDGKLRTHCGSVECRCKKLKEISHVEKTIKQPRKKNINKIITCKICGRNCRNLGVHAMRTHKLNQKAYYDTYHKLEREGKCVICGYETTFRGITLGYLQTCGNRCWGEYQKTHPELTKVSSEKANLTKLLKYGPINYAALEKSKETCLKKYGVDAYVKTDECKLRYYETCMEKYGVKSTMQLEETQRKARATTMKNFGVEYSHQSNIVRQKSASTCNERYGGNPLASPMIREKIENTNLSKYGNKYYVSSIIGRTKIISVFMDKYGTEYPLQNSDFRNNIINGSKTYRLKKYITIFGNEILYQSKTELKFIKRCENNNIRISNGPSIPYDFAGHVKIYHSDFIIEDNNGGRIVEIKGKHKWWFQDLASGKIKAKAKAAIKYSKENGYLPYKILFK